MNKTSASRAKTQMVICGFLLMGMAWWADHRQIAKRLHKAKVEAVVSSWNKKMSDATVQSLREENKWLKRKLTTTPNADDQPIMPSK